jgi:hypothetical protein
MAVACGEASLYTEGRREMAEFTKTAREEHCREYDSYQTVGEIRHPS